MPIPGNLISDNNSSFETSVGNWAAQNANTTIIRDTTRALDGSANLRVTSGAAGVTGPWLLAPNSVPVTAGRRYVHYWWAYSTVALSCIPDGDWYNGGTYVSSLPATARTITANTWTRLFVVGDAPATATSLALIMNFTATAGSQQVFIDQVFVGLALGPQVRTNVAVTRSYTW